MGVSYNGWQAHGTFNPTQSILVQALFPGNYNICAIAKPSCDCSKLKKVPHTDWEKSKVVLNFENFVRELYISSRDWPLVYI